MQIGSALIRQTLAYKPELRPSAAAALEEAQSIWLLLLSEKLEANAANASTEHVPKGDGGVGEGNAEDWERMKMGGSGYIPTTLFCRWSQNSSTPARYIH
jgi:hypothetical protein